jgi:hypothetical protein
MNQVFVGEALSGYNEYQKEVERRIRERSLDFEMWLRHVKKLAGRDIFQMSVNPDPIRQRELQEEYEKWKGKKE